LKRPFSFTAALKNVVIGRKRLILEISTTLGAQYIFEVTDKRRRRVCTVKK